MAEVPVDEGRLVAGRYRLIDQIGRGGMGTVWRARDELLERQVAVKRLHVSPQLEPDELATRNERTRREAQAAARINHPNVVSVHDVVEDDGLPCIVMEYVPSHTLGDVIKEANKAEPPREGGPLLPGEVARVGRGMVAALGAAHRAGVLHRDVKPGNVLLGEDGRVVLTDFGIAVASGTSTLTKTGELIGSIDYLAPELVKGGTPTPSSDLWALGATLYQALEGRPPFRRDTAVETAYAIVVDEHEPLRHAAGLAPLIEALLAKDPAERPPAVAVEQALRAPAAETSTALHMAGFGSSRTGFTDAGADPRVWPPATDSGEDTTRRLGTGTGQPPSQDQTPTPTSTSISISTPFPGQESTPFPGQEAASTPQSSAASEAPGPDAGAPAAPRRRRGRAVLWSSVAVVTAAVVAAGLLYVGSGHKLPWEAQDSTPPGRAAGTAPAAQQSDSPSPSASSLPPPPPLPQGYHRATEQQLGLSLPVPDGWTRKPTSDGLGVSYVDPTGLAALRVDVIDFAGPSQKQHFEGEEKDFRQQYPQFTRKRLDATRYQGDPAAIWEFTFQGSVRTFHGIDLGFGHVGGKQYGLYLSAPQASWNTYRPVFNNAEAGLRRDSTDQQ